jgi:hypothetical protein
MNSSASTAGDFSAAFTELRKSNGKIKVKDAQNSRGMMKYPLMVRWSLLRSHYTVVTEAGLWH